MKNIHTTLWAKHNLFNKHNNTKKFKKYFYIKGGIPTKEQMADVLLEATSAKTNLKQVSCHT